MAKNGKPQRVGYKTNKRPLPQFFLQSISRASNSRQPALRCGVGCNREKRGRTYFHNGAGVEWHLLKFFGVTIFSYIISGTGSGFSE